VSTGIKENTLIASIGKATGNASFYAHNSFLSLKQCCFIPISPKENKDSVPLKITLAS